MKDESIQESKKLFTEIILGMAYGAISTIIQAPEDMRLSLLIELERKLAKFIDEMYFQDFKDPSS